MAVLMINYDLRKPGRNYERLYEAIRAYEVWAHPVESVWLVDTGVPIYQVNDTLSQHIDANDKLIILPIEKRAGWATYNASDDIVQWLKQHVSA